MKRFVYKIICFFFILLVIDIVYGIVSDYLISHAKGGDVQRLHYTNRVMQDSIIILGSSRANHHYSPIIIQDSLGLSCFNCGKEGNGILMMYPLLINITNRYAPKLVIYEVTPSFDLETEASNEKYLYLVKPFYGDERIKKIFVAIDNKADIKMKSSMYKYNGHLLSMISDYFKPLSSDIKGYKFGNGIINYEPSLPSRSKEYSYDNLKLSVFEDLICLCKDKGIRLILTVSPQYKEPDDLVLEPIKNMALKYDIPLLNYYCDQRFINNREFFYDRLHMNKTGSEVYSRIFASDVRELLLQAPISKVE